MNRNTGNELRVHVAVAPAAARDRACPDCGKQITPPRHEADARASLCWQCRERPTEGWSAFCHQCSCTGAITRYPGMCRCGARWSGERICHCATCHLTFTAEGPFDAHRTGPMSNRRCLTETELRAKGYEPNSHGQWRKPAPEGIFRRGEDSVFAEKKGG